MKIKFFLSLFIIFCIFGAVLLEIGIYGFILAEDLKDSEHSTYVLLNKDFRGIPVFLLQISNGTIQ